DKIVVRYAHTIYPYSLDCGSLRSHNLSLFVRQLDDASRIQIAQVLMETEMDANLASLIEKLAKTTPADDVSDEEIEAEIKAVRNLNA
ncbi:MAG: hypothetical protein ACNYWU_09660, partial [Desulfobacterales bacterium]